MTLRTRRIIYLIFILIFVIVAPAVVFYASGYRYNFKKHKIQKTGMLILKTKPEEATIYLNNKIQKSKTPAKIGNLLPEEYLVRIEKENFYPWKKKLTIQSDLVTFAEDIILFKKSLPIEIRSGKIKLIALAPDSQKMVYVVDNKTSQEIQLLNLKNNEERLLYRASEKNKVDALEWDKESKKILVTILESKMNQQKSTSKKYLVINSENPTEINFYKDLGSFYFEFKNIKEKINLVDDYILIEGQNKFITLLNKKNNTLMIVEPKSNEIIFKTDARYAAWNKDGQKLLYSNGFELFVYDLATGEKNLILRYSQEIREPKWLSNNNYILFLLENSLRVIELDPRDTRNITELVKINEISQFEINKKEDKLYLLGKIGNDEERGIYELELQ
jgi:hypothetical protein